MFGDEARFGRMNRPRPCWAPIGIRPEVACQLIREYVYLYGAVSPKDGTCIFLILPAPDTECFQIFLETLAKKYLRAGARFPLESPPARAGQRRGSHLQSLALRGCLGRTRPQSRREVGLVEALRPHQRLRENAV